MRKLAILVGVLLVIVVAAVAVVPRLIDWNSYRGLIADQVERQTGRKITFGGNVGVTLLPEPALIAHDVRLSNIEGATAPDMAVLHTVQLTIAPGPLLTGHLHFESVRLVEPEISLEVTADGRPNWRFAPAGAPQASAGTTGQAAPRPSAPSNDETPVRFDNVAIENGTVIYRDARSGRMERFTNVNARLGAASAQGPLEGDGSFTYRGVPARLDLAIGQLVQGRTVPLTAALELPSSQSRLTLSGVVLGVGDKPHFKGDLKVDSRSLADLVATVAGSSSLPPLLRQSFGIESDLQISAEKASADKMSVRLGDTRAAARLEVAYGDGIDFSASLDFQRINLDALLALPAALPAALTSRTPAPAPGGALPARPAAVTDVPFALPANVHGMIDAAADAITYREGIISQFRLTAEMAGEDLTIHQLSAQLPGGSEASVFGVASLRAGGPRFEGSADAKASDFRRILRWTGFGDPQVDADRLRTVSVKAAQIVADPEQVQIGGVEAQIDGSRLTGGVTIALRSRPAFGAGFEIDRLNLDSYLPKAGPTTSTPAAQPTPPSGQASSPVPAAADPAQAAIGSLKGLADFDCNVRLGVKQLVIRDAAIQDVKLDATLVQSVLTLRDLSAGDVAGAAVSLKGGIDSSNLIPEFKALNLNLRTQDPERLFRFLDVVTPFPPRDLGPVTASATLDGKLLGPHVQASIQGRDFAANAEGEVVVLPVPGLDLKTSVRHKDLARLVRMTGADYRPAGALGGIDVSGRLRINNDRISLEGLSGQIGPTKAEGTISLAVTGARPRLNADVRADVLAIDQFLPAKRNSSLDTGPQWRPGIQPAAWPSPPARNDSVVQVARRDGANERWSRNPIDLSALRSFDADLKLAAGTLAYGPYRVDQATATANLANGILKLDRLSGRMFGGPLDGQGSVDASSVPRLSLAATLKDGRLDEALKALAGADSAGGSVNVDLALAGAGASEAEIVSSLSGQGSAAFRGIDPRKGGSAGAMAPVFEVLRGLDALSGLLGGAPGGAAADLTGTFRVADGTVRSEDLKLAAPAYEAAAKSTVDLPRWQITADGSARFKDSGVDAIPFAVAGSLDAPDVKLSPPDNMKNLSIRVPEKLLKDKDSRRQLLDSLKKSLLGN